MSPMYNQIRELPSLSLSGEVPSEREKSRSSSHAALSLSVDVHLSTSTILYKLEMSLFLNGREIDNCLNSATDCFSVALLTSWETERE